MKKRNGLYNSERKESFLNTTENEKLARSAFNTFSAVEFETGEDLSNLPLETVQSVVDNCFSSREFSVKNVLKKIYEYVEWCEDRGYPTNDDLLHIELNMGSKIRSSMVASPFHLEYVLDSIFDSLDKKSIDCIYRCWFWMAFAGINQDRSVCVTVKDINFDTMTIDGSYPIYREAIPAFRFASEAQSFMYYHKLYKSSKDRASGDSLVRGFGEATENRKAYLRSNCCKRVRGANQNITYNEVRLSGLFYRTFEREQCGLPIDFDSYILQEYCFNRNDEWKPDTQMRQRLWIARKQFMSDYRNWKEAFFANMIKEEV